jgi:hypothetical protein
MFDGVNSCFVDRQAHPDISLNAGDIAEIDARRAVVIQAEPLLDPPHESTAHRVQPITERGGPNENLDEPRRLVGFVVEHNPINPAHLASIPIAHALVQHIPNDIHVSLPRSPAE